MEKRSLVETKEYGLLIRIFTHGQGPGYKPQRFNDARIYIHLEWDSVEDKDQVVSLIAEINGTSL
jgi:hypothetical protein